MKIINENRKKVYIYLTISPKTLPVPDIILNMILYGIRPQTGLIGRPQSERISPQNQEKKSSQNLSDPTN